MTPTEFIEKWTQLNTLKLSEKAGYQTHFNDLCEVVGHPKPLQQPHLPDFAPDNFSFEKCAAMVGSKGGHGWADVWKNRAFAFEYKKKGRSLDEAYAQLIRYHDDLNNVPVLATCDFARLHFHIKRTNCKTVEHIIPLQNFAEGPNQTFLKNVFYHPEWIENGESIEKVTQRVAAQLASIAISMGTPERYGAQPFRVARFLDRVVFTLFAEDCGLLPPDEFKKILDKGVLEAPKISRQIHNLWRSMATGDDFGATEIRHFNGALFDEILAEEPLLMQPHEVRALQEAANQDWSEVDPSIFGTLFERALDPKKRSQLGAHYTSRSDIETLIEPVILKPLRARWNQVKPLAESALAQGDDLAARNYIKSWLWSAPPNMIQRALWSRPVK